MKVMTHLARQILIDHLEMSPATLFVSYQIFFLLRIKNDHTQISFDNFGFYYPIFLFLSVSRCCRIPPIMSFFFPLQEEVGVGGGG